MLRADDDRLTSLCAVQYPRLVGLIALRVGDQQVAEELAQEALIRLCQRWPHVDRPEAWLTRIALNVASSWWRRRLAERRASRRHGVLADVGPPPPTADIIAVRQAVSRLPPRERTAIILRWFEDLSVAETAEVMRCPTGTVKSLTHRALSRLEADLAVPTKVANHA